MASVSLKAINRIYPGGAHAVKDVSLEVADGEFMVLVGPSGCGKSTTLRMVAGLEPIDHGELYICDRMVANLDPASRDIAMVFQNYALYPHMTCAENMAFGLRVRGVDKQTRRARVAEAAELLDITQLLDRKPGMMSGGQRQRVAIGRAIVRNPAVFLFDEPLSNLDAKLRGEMRTELSALHRRLRATMLYVTHDQVEAMTLGDRICVLRDGIVQQVGSPMDLYHHPANAFVARFIGTPPMNVWVGQISGSNFQAGQLSFQLEGSWPEGAAEAGLRPEELLIADSVPVDMASLKGKISIVERMGSESLVHARVGEQAMIIKAAGTLMHQDGAEVTICYRPQDVHVFA